MWATVALILTAFGGEVPSLHRYEQAQIHMGSDFSIVLYADSEKTANHGFAAAFARIAELDAIMSDYRAESELSLLSAGSPHAQPVALSDDLFDILQRAQVVSEATDGAFDVTVGPLTKLWRRSRRQKTLPPPDAIAEARAATGFRSLKLDASGRTAQLLHPHMRLDLGGIAQGYAADAALGVLRALDISRALVNASGDIVAGDPPPNTPGWKVGIAPLDAKGPPSRFLTVDNRAISTSGDAFQFVEIDGVRYSHIVDPQTGLGLTKHRSVTIVANDCTTADAWATAVSVLGPDRGIPLVEKIPGASALVLEATPAGVRETVSHGFPTSSQAAAKP